MSQSDAKEKKKIEVEPGTEFKKSKKPRFPFINKQKLNDENDITDAESDYNILNPIRFNYTESKDGYNINMTKDVNDKDSETIKLMEVKCNESARCLVMSLNYSLLYIKNDLVSHIPRKNKRD